MRKQLKNKEELFDYLTYGYIYELEDVITRKGKQKRLKDNELELELRGKTKENVKVDNLFVELKLGPSYNRTENPWIQIYTIQNKSGTTGRYVGISFIKETNEIELWIGFGRSGKKKAEVFELAKEYKIKYTLIEPNLKYGFEYKTEYDAVVIRKKISLRNFNEEDFERDLKYITDLYKEYETRFENATISQNYNEYEESPLKTQITYEEINENMLTIIEKLGNIATLMKELKK